MTVGYKNSLGGKENLPDYDFAVSPQKRSAQNFFSKTAESSLKKDGIHQKLQPIFKNDSSIV